jgi:hypothetical protein
LLKLPPTSHSPRLLGALVPPCSLAATRCLLFSSLSAGHEFLRPWAGGALLGDGAGAPPHPGAGRPPQPDSLRRYHQAAAISPRAHPRRLLGAQVGGAKGLSLSTLLGQIVDCQPEFAKLCPGCLSPARPLIADCPARLVLVELNGRREAQPGTRFWGALCAVGHSANLASQPRRQLLPALRPTTP